FRHDAIALGAEDVVANVALAILLLPATAEDPGAIGVLVDDAVVVEDVAVLRGGPHLPAAQADGLGRAPVLQRPGSHVEHVNVLLDVEVARQPGEVVPVAHLPVHVGPAFPARLHPDAAAQVVALNRQDVAELAVPDAFDRVAEALVVAQAQAGD